MASDPEGAEVLVDGSPVGTTPVRATVRRKDAITLIVRKQGYEPEQRSTRLRPSTLGMLDLIGGAVILVPFLGLLSSAAWEHDPASFSILLRPESAAPEQGGIR